MKTPTMKTLRLAIALAPVAALALGCANDTASPEVSDDHDPDTYVPDAKADLRVAASSFAGRDGLSQREATACSYTLASTHDNELRIAYVNSDAESAINIGLEFRADSLPLANDSHGTLNRGYTYHYKDLVLTVEREIEGRPLFAEVVVGPDLRKIYSTRIRRVETDVGGVASYLICGY